MTSSTKQMFNSEDPGSSCDALMEIEIPDSVIAMHDTKQEEVQTKKKKRKRSEDPPEEKKERPPRKARVLYSVERVDKCVDENRRFVLKKDQTGKFNTQEMRNFVVSVRKNPELSQKYISNGTIDLVLGGEKITLPVHGRNAKRTPGLAKARAYTILNRLTRYGVINGRYVSVLRDFGYGGNSAHSLVSSYQSAAASDLVSPQESLKVESPTMVM
jgi:hypothetical protein